jgi:hypothetical protein
VPADHPQPEDSTTGYQNSHRQSSRSCLAISQVCTCAVEIGLKLLKYHVGWLTAIGWQVYSASVFFLVGTVIQGLIVLNDASYIFKRWHGTLLAIAANVLSIAFNTVLASQLPYIRTSIHVRSSYADSQ